MKAYKYFIHYQSINVSGLIEDNNCVIVLNQLILDDMHIQNIQKEISSTLVNCNKIIIKNFILLHIINGHCGDLK